MDESFDMWRIPKVKNGLSQVLRPVGRERPARPDPARPQPPERHPVEHRQRDSRAGRADGGKSRKRLTGIAHEEDPTRPTTSAFNNPHGAIKNDLAENVDVPGLQL